MSDPLHNRLHRLRHRIRQVLCLYGLSWVVAVVLGAVLLAGLLDWLVHLDDPGVRLILGWGILAGGGWIAWRFLIEPLLRPLPDVELALRIERRYPGFKDSLASTVQFLEAGADPRLGSPDLQRRVIDQTLGRVERIDVAEIVETRDLRRVTAAAVGVCLLTLSAVALNQAAAATALNRLVFPFSAAPWPKSTILRLIDGSLQPVEYDPQDPLRVARGDTLELYVENIAGGLPDSLTVEYRYADAQTASETLRRTTLRDARGGSREVGALRLLVSRGPLWFRAVGGDDRDMPWYEVQAVPPPVLEDFQITLTPPAYTGREVDQLPRGVGHVQGLVGTQVDLSATSKKPLRSARLRIKDQPPNAAELSQDGRRVTLSFLIKEPGIYSYWFDLKDRQGFENAAAPRYEIRGIADLVPDVAIEKPETDRTITPNAVLPLRIAAKDDLGLKEVRLHYRLDGSEESVGPPAVLFSGPERPDQWSIEHLWNLADLSLTEGMRIIFHAEATDDYDLGPEHVGRSISRTLTVVSAQEKGAELASKQGKLLGELERIHKTQAQAHDQTGELRVQLQTAGRLRPEDHDLLRRIELDQRQIASRLAGPVEGIESRARELLSELDQNRIDDPETVQRLEHIADELALLREENLSAIEQELTRARKEQPSGKSAPSPSAAHEQADALADAFQHQEAVLESLGEMLRQLSQWRTQRELTEDLADLTDIQKQLNRESAEIGRRTLGKPAGELTPQQQADLSRMADRQNRQADRLEQLRSRLGETARKTAETSPAAAEPLADAEQFVRRQATPGRMREAAGQLARNNVGEAGTRQQQVLEELDELQDILRNRGGSDLETLVQKLRQAEQELDTLRKRQDELLRQVEEAMQKPNEQDRKQELERLQREQRQVRDEVAGMARRLRRLQARQPGASAQRAAGRMQQAEGDLARGEGKQARQDQQEALDDLDQARRELARARQAAEEQLARELLERIADELQAMIGRQQNVIDETERLDAEYQQRGNWTRGQLRSLLDLAEVQRGLKDETDGLAEKIQAAEVFALALRGAARNMQTAADRLARRQTDESTLDAEKAAKQRFLDLIAALESAKSQGAQQAGGGGDGGDAGPQSDGIPHLAQLQMLRTLQQDLLERTSRLDRFRDEQGDLTDEQQAELDALADEQGRLADLTRNLIQTATEAFQLDDKDGD